MDGAPRCSDLDRETDDHPDRVGVFADAKPECACEHESLSGYSPGVVADEEIIARFVCAPLHVHRKRAELNSSFFSYAFSRGVSVQRLDASTDEELVGCVKGLLTGSDDRQWLGYVTAPASAIRALAVGGDETQTFCVADAALAENRAHAEIHCARRIPEADRLERRAELTKLFNTQGIQNRRALREGKVWEALPGDLKERPLPAHWNQLA